MARNMNLLTKEENRVLENLADAYIWFSQLQTLHPDDRKDFSYAIHMAQNIVLSRPAMRKLHAINK